MPIETIDTSTFNDKPKVSKIDKIQQKVEQQEINMEAKRRGPVDPFKIFRAKAPKPPSAKEIETQIKIEKMMEQEEVEKNEKVLCSREANILKMHANNILSMPYQKNPVKRRILANNLQENTQIQEYVNDNLILNCCRYLNPNLRFALHFGLEMYRTEDIYKQMLLQVQQQPAKESKVEESKVQDVDDDAKPTVFNEISTDEN